jgi:hypothetical protein
MPDFKYSGYKSFKNRRHFVSERAFLFSYIGNKKERTEIISELGSLFTSQSFAPFELASGEGRHAIHVYAKRKNIRIPISIAHLNRSVFTNVYYIGVSYGSLGSKFQYERSKLEHVLERACRSLAGKPEEV